MAGSDWTEKFQLDDAFRREFELLESIGKGAMGEVVKARQLAIRRTVAIKFLAPQFFEDDDSLRRFRAEAEILARLNHPNIVQVITFQGSARVPYIVLEYVEGGSLRKRVESGGPLSVGEALDVVEGVGLGLHQAHGAKIIHRDLKSENVLLGAGGVPKIVDFGLAKLTEGRGDQTASGVILGTPEYMSPEQVRGEPLDGRTDLYSAGIILFEMLVGRVPFKNDAVSRTLLDQLELPPPFLRDFGAELPPELDELVHRAMNKDRLQRYRSAEAWVLAVRGARRSLERQNLLARRAEKLGDGGATLGPQDGRRAPGGKGFQTQATGRAEGGGRPRLGAAAAPVTPPPVSGSLRVLISLTAAFLLLGAATLLYRSTLGARRSEAEVRAEALAKQKVEEIAGHLERFHEGGGEAQEAFLAGEIARSLDDGAAGEKAREALLEILEASVADPVVLAAGLPLLERGHPAAFEPVLGVYRSAEGEVREQILQALVTGVRKAKGGNRFLRDEELSRLLATRLGELLEERFGGRFSSEERVKLLQLHGDVAGRADLQEAMVGFAEQTRFDRTSFASPEEFSMLGRLARDPRMKKLRAGLERRYFHQGNPDRVVLPEDRLAALKEGLGR